MTTYRLASAAKDDLSDIWDFSIERWSVAQAEKYTRLVEAAFGNVAAGRVKGRPMDDIRQGYLRLSVGSHYVFYRWVDNRVEIIRVLHQHMDAKTHLNPG